MNEAIISAVGLSKAYDISHQKEMRADYGTLKDDLANLVKRPFGGRAEGRRETFWALRDVGFEVQRGEIFGVIGENGSGKSTLLKILSRIIEPTAGEVHLRGRTASLLEVGTGFHPELTGRENIFFNGSMLGMSRTEIRDKFDEIVAFSEIEKFLDTPVKFYSSGMYVRLAFAVAAHLEPEILILDEVLAVGDAAFQAKSLAKITSSMEAGRTVLFVSHSMGAVSQLCHRGILLKKGKVAFAGPADELVEKYNQLTTAKIAGTEKSSWDRDKGFTNPYFVPKSLYITDSEGKKIKGPLSNDQDHWVNIEGALKTTAAEFNIGYAIRSVESRSFMYLSLSTDGPKDAWPKLKKGAVRFRGRLPQHLLNAGHYKLSLVASLHNREWLYEPEAGNGPTIEIFINGGLSQSPYWPAPRSGLLAPIIDWEIE